MRPNVVALISPRQDVTKNIKCPFKEVFFGPIPTDFFSRRESVASVSVAGITNSYELGITR